MDTSRKFWSRDRLRSQFGFVWTHRTLQCFLIHFQEATSLVLLVFQFLIFSVSLPIYLGIRIDDILFKIAMLGTVANNLNVYIIGSRRAGWIYEDSREILDFWRKQRTNGKLFGKYLNSFRPIRLRIGSFNYYNRDYVISGLQSIFQFTIDLLLTYP